MGYNNPPIKWSELERKLSDRSRPGSHGGRPVTGDGGDSPAWSQHRGPYVADAVHRPEHAVPYAEAAAAYSMPTVFGAELSLGLTGPQNGVADPEGSHLLVLAEGQDGYHTLAGAITKAQLAGGEKGKPVYVLEELAAVGRKHWLILTGCRKGLVRQALELGGHADGPA